MVVLSRFTLAWLVASCMRAVAAQEPQPPTEFFEVITKRIEVLQMTWQEESARGTPELLKQPVLRCNDPTRQELDGAIWLWLSGKRPVAAMCVIYFAKGKWNYELVSLTDEAVEVTGRPSWSWRPAALERPWTKIEHPLPQSPRARQLAMRDIVRQLEASEVHRGQTYALRLLERPIYTYADEASGILDGALFVLANGTNPEILMQLEARESDGEQSWQVSFARLSSAELTVKLDGKTLWTVDQMTADNPQVFYYGVNESK